MPVRELPLRTIMKSLLSVLLEYSSLVVRFVPIFLFCSVHADGIRRLFFRSLGPNLNSIQGMGRSARDRKPNTLPAQWMPSFSYMGVVNRRNTAPRRYRTDPFAAIPVLDSVPTYVLTTQGLKLTRR